MIIEADLPHGDGSVVPQQLRKPLEIVAGRLFGLMGCTPPPPPRSRDTDGQRQGRLSAFKSLAALTTPQTPFAGREASSSSRSAAKAASS